MRTARATSGRRSAHRLRSRSVAFVMVVGLALSLAGLFATRASGTTPPVPTVTAVIANTGPTIGGQRVSVIGTNLAGTTAVNFGSNGATVSANTNTVVTVTEPAGSAGTVDVTVTTAGGTSVTGSPDHYTYVAPPTLYVPNWNTNNVTVINPITNTVTGTISLPSCSEPEDVAIAPNAQTAYVTCWGNGNVFPINTATNAVGTAIATGSSSGAITIAPNGQTAYPY